MVPNAQTSPVEFALETQSTPHSSSTVHPAAEDFHVERSCFDTMDVGNVLGKYELIELIGRGSTSVVFRGQHRKLRFPVAVKILNRRALDTDPQLLQQLATEAIHLARINHPNVVRLWDLDDEAEDPYLVLEYVRGGTLADLIRTKGRVPFAFTWAVIRQAVEGLAAAQEQGIVHRDIKPANLLLGDDGLVKVADLGLAMIAIDRRSKVITGAETLTMAGTAAYLAPEQAENPSGVTFSADMYSLGATLYHALAGRMVFEGRSASELLLKHVREKPIPPAHFVSDLPAPCSAVILKMLAKRPEDRFANYEELRLALAQAVGDRRAPRPLAEAFLDFAVGK